jgi:DNA-directed RNA polymerase subunit RPC12/RpoP
MDVEVNVGKRNKPKIGLKDGPHHYLRCSRCNKGLADIWITGPDEDIDWTLKATCPYCKESGLEEGSYPLKIKGLFFPAGFGEKDKDVLYTSIADIKTENGTQTFIIHKKS